MMTENSYMIPIIFHNWKGYDSHLIMQYITCEYASSSTAVISTSSEKFLSFQIGNLRFLDSLQIFTASLDTLVQCLAADGTTNLVIPLGIIQIPIWFSQREITLTNPWTVERNFY